MKTNGSLAWLTRVMVCNLLLGISTFAAPADSTTSSNLWQYTLLPDSTLLDDCPICGRPAIPLPLTGTFNLRLIEAKPEFAKYAWETIAWTANRYETEGYRLSGQGQYTVTTAGFQTLNAAIYIDDGITNKLCYFKETTEAISLPWPTIQINLDQTNGTLIQQYSLQLLAAPFREMWFSTRNGLHAAIWNDPSNFVSSGDLISSSGRIIKRNGELVRSFTFMPPTPDLGLDALDVLPGGEIAFSIEQNIFSESDGPLHNGDVLSSKGRVITNYAALIGAFSPEPPAADEGLDALQLLPNGEIYFSITNDFWSESKGQTIRHGDLLSSKGIVIKSNQDLVAQFHPANPRADYGLDAFYVWPHGEIWFSVEIPFYNDHFEAFGAGDILSDRGYVVFRNLSLVSPFQPLEDLADFGLDALFVITDTTPPPSAVTPLTCAPFSLDGSNIILNWTGSGRVFQVERAANILGPWLPASLILTSGPFTDQIPAGNQQYYYRVRQW